MANTNLKEAKAAKNDEFYTQFHDIEIEMNAYLEYDPDVFRGKTVLLPCDDPEWSNFTRYFAAKFDELGLKKLISTSYAPDAKKMKLLAEPSLFEKEAPQFDPQKAQTKGKILGMCENEDLYSMKTRVYTTYECKTAYLKKFGKTGTYDLNASGVITRNGIQEKVYQRILIINRKFAPNS